MCQINNKKSLIINIIVQKQQSVNGCNWSGHSNFTKYVIAHRIPVYSNIIDVQIAMDGIRTKS